MNPSPPLAPPRETDPLERIGFGSSFPAPWRPAWYVLAGLFLLCLVPRLLTAWKIGPVCNDGYYYASIAQSLDRGDMQTALSYLNLNVYPAILAMLHQAGLEWILAGKLWGALAGSLAVLPLYGWVRRLFDARVAAIAGFFYAVHPELIELSIEPIREATFWLFCSLSLYLFVRGAQERRLAWFALAGTALAAAVHTRSEGWLLVIPLVGWTLAEWRSAAPRTWRLPLGVPLCLAMTPLLLFVVNVTWLRNHPQWEWGRLKHVEMGVRWLTTSREGLPNRRSHPLADEAAPPSSHAAAYRRPAPLVITASLAVRPVPPPPRTISASPAAPSTPPDATDAGIASRSAARPPLPSRARVFLSDLLQSLGPINLGLLLLGLFAARRTLLRGWYWPLLLLAGLLLAGIWIRLWWGGGMNGRWFYMVYLALIPWQAAGAVVCISWLGRRTSSEPLRLRRQTVALFCLLATIGWCDVATTTHQGRDAHRVQGEWLAREYGRPDYVVVNRGAERVGYYFMQEMPAFPPTGCSLRKLICITRPDAVIYSTKRESAEDLAKTRKECAMVGLFPVDVPGGDKRLLVFVPREPTAEELILQTAGRKPIPVRH
jgi:4-amino-4-deoxy-L-arabinose transferase-like glycosyltransferase